MLSPADGGRTKEICRYLGYGSRIPDPCILSEIEEAEKLLLPLISKKEIHRTFPLASADDGPVRIGDVLMADVAGTGVDVIATKDVD